MTASLDSSVLSGAVMPLINEEFAKGRHFYAVEVCVELGKIFHENGQFDELWAWQLQCRSLWLRYTKSAIIRAKAKNQSGNNIEATTELDYVMQVLHHCQELGIFSDVGYRVKHEHVGRMIVFDEYGFAFRTLAGLCWRRYMLKHCATDPKDNVAAKLLKSFETRHVSSLQARIKRLLFWQSVSRFSASFRRACAQRQFLSEPSARKTACEMIAGQIRRKLLMKKLAALKTACADLHIMKIDRETLDLSTRQALKDRYLTAISSDAEPRSQSALLNRHSTTLDLSEEIFHFCMYPFPRSLCVGPSSNAGEGRISKINISELLPADDSKISSSPYRQRNRSMNEAERVVGVDATPQVGMRVKLRKQALEEFPELFQDSAGGIGTITWVDPDDLDGDGITGDICTVLWGKTGIKDNYRTGFEGQFRLECVNCLRKRNSTMGENEKVVGADIEPKIGLRVALRKQAIALNPQMLDGSGGGPGTIVWVDPDDLDDDGIPGDICTVLWDRTGKKLNHHIGLSGDFQLSIVSTLRNRVAAVSDKEVVVGMDVAPEVGMRVVLRQQTLEEFPDLLQDSGGGIGTIIWVDPEDLDGDGVTGDICSVVWDNTGLQDDYRTGHEGQFRLAKDVPEDLEFKFSPRCSWAGLNIQRVFRGFQVRRSLMQELVARFIISEEINHANKISVSAHCIQSAFRQHIAKSNFRFQRQLKALAGEQKRAMNEVHSKALLRIQSVFRGHCVRANFKALMMTKQLIRTVQERTLKSYSANPERTLYHSRVVKCRWRMKAWRNICSRKKLFQGSAVAIISNRIVNVQSFVMKRWSQHHEIVLHQQECARRILHCLASAVVRYQLQTAFDGWNVRVKAKSWLKTKLEHALRLEKRNLGETMRWILRVFQEFVKLSRSQDEAGKEIGIKPMSRLSRFTLSEWHATAHRRKDVKSIGLFILPLWTNFVLYRCFIALKNATVAGSISNNSSLISMLKLQSKLSSVTKGATSVIQRFSTEHELNRSVKGLAICKNIPEMHQNRLAAASATNETLFLDMKLKQDKDLRPGWAQEARDTSRVPGFWEERSKMMLTEPNVWHHRRDSSAETVAGQGKLKTLALIRSKSSDDAQSDVDGPQISDRKFREVLLPAVNLKPGSREAQYPPEGPIDGKLATLTLPALKQAPSSANSSSSQVETNRKLSMRGGERNGTVAQQSFLPALQAI